MKENLIYSYGGLKMNEIKQYDLYEFQGDITNDGDINKYIEDSNRFYRNKIKSKLNFDGHTIDFGQYKLENGLYKQFIHISSFLEKDDNFFIPKPCKKKQYIESCNNCTEKRIVNRINNEDRYFCFHRCEHMVYIINIFKLINTKNMDNIDIYREKIYANKRMQSRNLVHIRYTNENIYYYILLEDLSEKGYYSFVCGFPIFNGTVKAEKNKIFGKMSILGN